VANIGYGYGSECQLLRYLGRHRMEFDRRVIGAIGGTAVEWRDSRFDPSNCWGDGEWKRLDFLPEDSPARVAYETEWP
jgi:hypothetical protein